MRNVRVKNNIDTGICKLQQKKNIKIHVYWCRYKDVIIPIVEVARKMSTDVDINKKWRNSYVKVVSKIETIILMHY